MEQTVTRDFKSICPQDRLVLEALDWQLESKTLTATIQLNGSKLFYVLEDGSKVLSPSLQVLPGDIVKVNSGKLTFHSRTPLVTLGTVKSYFKNQVYLHFPFFGAPCPSSFRIDPIDNKINPGDRYVLFFPSDSNTPKVISAYTSEPIHDAQVLKDIYTYSLPYTKQNLNLHLANHLYTLDTLVDHTNDFVITIDPETAKDFDDAISWNEETREVFIHIVDIAHADLSEEEELRLRTKCQTLYLDTEAVHLLSEENASHTLSLVENKLRHTITTRVKLSEEGFVESYDIYRSIITVKKRLFYKTAKPFIPEWLYKLLEKQESKLRYSIDIPFITTTQSNEIKKTYSSDYAHKFVERCMVLCNMVVSKHLQSHAKYIPNRFHNKVRGFRPLEASEKTNHPEVDSFLLLKRYAKAKYDVDEHGHFGLGITEYCHFTSPMRRYADVLVHRVLAGWFLPKEILDKEVEWINMRETLTDSCHRLYNTWKINRYIFNAGSCKIYDVWVTGVSAAGVMWFMPELNVNGFCHVSNLAPSTKWYLEEDSLKSSQGSYKVGDECHGYFRNIDPTTYVVNLSLQKK